METSQAADVQARPLIFLASGRVVAHAEWHEAKPRERDLFFGAEAAMTDEQLGDDVWMRREGDKQRAAEKAAKKAARDALRDMTTELGVFVIGLGIIIAALMIFAAMIFQSPGADFSPSGLAVLLTPSLVMVIAGTCVLLSRTKLSVRLATWIVALAFVVQSILSMNPINWILSAACLFLIWRTAGGAIRQIEDRRS
jgi:hypothetical protein